VLVNGTTVCLLSPLFTLQSASDDEADPETAVDMEAGFMEKFFEQVCWPNHSLFCLPARLATSHFIYLQSSKYSLNLLLVVSKIKVKFNDSVLNTGYVRCCEHISQIGTPHFLWFI